MPIAYVFMQCSSPICRNTFNMPGPVRMNQAVYCSTLCKDIVAKARRIINRRKSMTAKYGDAFPGRHMSTDLPTVCKEITSGAV